jgi:hypothetical protein
MPKKKTKKPTNKKPAKTAKTINKSAFVRKLPASMPAKDVVAKAKEQGITLTEKHVYAIRSIAKKKTGSKRKPGRPPKSAASPKAAPAKAAAPSGGLDRQVVQLVIDHGLSHIDAALAAIRAKLQRTLV